MNKIEIPPFSSHFYDQELHFDKPIGCLCLPDGQISINLDMKSSSEQLEGVSKKIQTLNLPQIIMATPPQKRECFINNLLRLRKILPCPKPKQTKQQAIPFYLELTTTCSLDRFFDYAKCQRFSLQHFSTYPTSHPIEATPTDHASIIELPTGYHIALCDGMGHNDPKGIGLVAKTVVQTLISEPLSQRAKDKETYQAFLKTLNEKYRYQEGTSLLEVEIIHKKTHRWKVTVANFGDSALIAIDQKGKITFATKDRKIEKKPNSQDPIGMLGIGSAMGDELIAYVDYIRLKCNGGWIIACSDGLVEPFRNNETGLVDADRFEWAYRTGEYLPPKSVVLPQASTELNMSTLTDNLQRAVKSAAQKNHNGDDVTIVVVKLDEGDL